MFYSIKFKLIQLLTFIIILFIYIFKKNKIFIDFQNYNFYITDVGLIKILKLFY